MKIIHLMRKEKFTKGICKFYELYFKNGNHEICYILNDDKSEINNTLMIPQYELHRNAGRLRFYFRFWKLITQYDFIVLHSMMTLDNMMKIIMRPLYHRIVWIEWGADLYNWEPKGRFRGITYKINRKIRERCNTVVCIFPPDVDYYRVVFPKSKAKVFYAPYQTSTIGKQYLFHLDNPVDKKKSRPIHIMIGHSATRQIRHIEALKRIKRFADEDIIVSIPLAYGDKEYAQEIILFAKSILNRDKLHIMTDLLPEKDYYNFINTVDVAIFDTDRQIGLGNIIPLIFQGTKLYLRKDTVMYKYFDDNGVPVQDIGMIDRLSFPEFSSPAAVCKKEKYDSFVNSYVNLELILSLWTNVYSSLDV